MPQTSPIAWTTIFIFLIWTITAIWSTNTSNSSECHNNENNTNVINNNWQW